MPPLRLILATHRLVTPGGSETYLITLAEQLERLGHEVWVHAVDHGDVAQAARERGVRIAPSTAALPGDPDAIVVQDAIVAYGLSDRHPATPQVFVTHSADYDLQRPPAIDGVTAAVVVMNDRVASRIGALAKDHEIVRLTQPIDIRRFAPKVPIRREPREMLVLSNHLAGERCEPVRRACTEGGMACRLIGRHGQETLRPEAALASADVVVGCGRSALEAMACGRAVYVYGHVGGDGWVTRESYPRLEADGFAGMALEEPVDAERVVHDLVHGYAREMGTLNRDLAVRHHSAAQHAVELVRLLKSVAGRRRTAPEPTHELARMVRVQWNTDSRAAGMAAELRRAGERLRAAEEAAAAAREQARAATELVAAWERRHGHVVESRRYRVARWLAAPADALRRRALRQAGGHSDDSTPST